MDLDFVMRAGSGGFRALAVRNLRQPKKDEQGARGEEMCFHVLVWAEAAFGRTLLNIQP
jgi:hypothetical protein